MRDCFEIPNGKIAVCLTFGFVALERWKIGRFITVRPLIFHHDCDEGVTSHIHPKFWLLSGSFSFNNNDQLALLKSFS